MQLNFVDLAGNLGAKDLITMQEKFSYILLCYAIDSRRSYEGLDEWIDAIE